MNNKNKNIYPLYPMNQNNITSVVNQIQRIANDQLQGETYKSFAYFSSQLHKCRADCTDNSKTWKQYKNCRTKCVDAGNIWGDRFYSHRLPIKNAIEECVTFCHKESQNNNVPEDRQMLIFKNCVNRCPKIIDSIVVEAGVKINNELERMKRDLDSSDQSEV